VTVLKKSYFGLIVLIVLFTVLSLTYTAGFAEWLGAYLSNIAAGIIGSLIIILLVDRIIERNREKERLRVVNIALRRLRIPILWHMNLLCNIYKAATKNKPAPLPSTFEDTFTDHYYREISFLDFKKESPVALKTDWFNYLYLETKSFKEKLEQFIDTYASFLDVRLIDLLERIVNSHFLFLIPQAKSIPNVDRQYGWKRVYTLLSGVEQLVKEHVSLMLELVEYFNSISDLPILLNQEIWRDDVAPKWGSGRVSSK